MEQALSSIQPYAALISSILSLAALGFILRLSTQMKEVYSQRVEAVDKLIDQSDKFISALGKGGRHLRISD